MKSPCSSTPAAPPAFFPLPPRGQDPHFGLGRSSYYELEAAGLLTLVRVRKPGNVRGRVLVPYARMTKLMQRYAAESEISAKRKAAHRRGHGHAGPKSETSETRKD